MCFKKTKHAKFSEKQTFRTPRCVSRSNKCLLFGKFGELCFLETHISRFALLSYYRPTQTLFSYEDEDIGRLAQLRLLPSWHLLHPNDLFGSVRVKELTYYQWFMHTPFLLRRTGVCIILSIILREINDFHGVYIKQMVHCASVPLNLVYFFMSFF